LWLKNVERGNVYPLFRGQAVVIGRGRHADIDLDNPFVSRQHCEIDWNGCRVWVSELVGGGLTAIISGTSHGNVYSAGRLLRLGDVLRLGPVHLRLGTSSRVDPAWLRWHDGLLVSMAQKMYDSRDFRDRPVLADALEEAGCSDQNILGHCRQPGGEHVRGCWLVDLLLGRL
jgi:hypothetical protein